ncbi:MAG: DUF3789 domain-containing protein [Coprococcus sp.]
MDNSLLAVRDINHKYIVVERSSRMSEFLFFIIGTMLGGLFGVVCICCLQINRLSERKEEDNAKKKCADTFPSD